MSINLLRDGILQENWSLVRQAFTAITGEELSSNPAEEQSQQLKGKSRKKVKLTSMRPKVVKVNEQKVAITDPLAEFRMEPGEASEDGGRRRCQSKPFQKNFKNQWRDTGKEAGKDKKWAKVYPTEPCERRPPVQLVKVICAKCEREDEISPSLAPKNIGDGSGEDNLYVCDNCLKRQRRAV